MNSILVFLAGVGIGWLVVPHLIPILKGSLQGQGQVLR